jgi:hypothetical protein
MGLFLAAIVLGAVFSARAADPFSVRAVSPRAGLLFTDGEPVDVRVQVSGAKAPVGVTYTVEESGGPWKAKGEVALAELQDGAGERPLPLQLPGRGLYHLKLAATSGGGKAEAETWVAIVFAPAKPDEKSPWGIFYTPHIWFDKANPNGARDAALSHRLLGASWSRLNFWAHSFEKIPVADGKVKAEYPLWRSYARALRDEGIFILGEIAQCPRELSSRPDETATVGDAGPLWGRVKPRDYGLWDQLIERLAADFRDEIQVWEIWNEANLRGRYWSGTPEELAELIEHTSKAFRRGNAEARIAACGFVGDIGFADRLFQLGIGKHLDILSVHYTDERPGEIVAWQSLLKKHGLNLPIWNTEERSAIPLRNVAGGIERSFKFIHVLIGYPEYQPLVRRDWTVLPAGIAFSVGAHCIGAARCIGHKTDVPGYDVYLFQRGEEIVGAFDRNQKTGVPRLFGPAATGVILAVEPLAGHEPTVTDIWGRSRLLKTENGRATLPLSDPILFVNGCRRLEVGKVEAQQAGEALVFEAESGRWSKGWGNNPKGGFSGGRILEIWKDEEPDADGYWAELKFSVPSAGRYEFLFCGNVLSRLKPPRSLSPFTWRIDDGEEREAKDATPMLPSVAGAPEGLSILGTVELKAGDHAFRLKLAARRDEPDKHYALWFDAIALRKKEQRR